MLNKTVIVVFLALSTSGILQAQPVSKDEELVQQTVIKLFEALANRDSVGIRSYCTTDNLLLEHGKIWNTDSLILKAITLNTSPDFKRTNSFDFINTSISGNTAWVTYHLRSAIVRSGQPVNVEWLETIIAVKEKKQWKVKLLHSTMTKRS